MFLRLIAAGVLLVFAGVVLWWFGRVVTVVGETVVLLGDSVAVVGVIVAATGILALVCYNIWRWWQRYTSEEARHERAARQSIDEEIDALKERRRTLGDWLTLEDYPLRPSEAWLGRFELLADRLGVRPDLRAKLRDALRYEPPPPVAPNCSEEDGPAPNSAPTDEDPWASGSKVA